MRYVQDRIKSFEDTFAKSGALSQYYETNVPNVMKSSDQQQYESLKKNFITAVLRQESGAAISSGEFDNEEKKYFPQPGDTQDTVKQKQDARNMAIRTMYEKAGSDTNGNSFTKMWDAANKPVEETKPSGTQVQFKSKSGKTYSF